jgi:hypothetical protein
MEGEVSVTTPEHLAIYVKGSWTSDDFTAAGFWVDDCIKIGSKRELEAIAKGVDAKYSITGLGEVKWVLSMLLECDCSAHTISILQEAFIDSTLVRSNLTDSTTVSMPELSFPQWTAPPRRTS